LDPREKDQWEPLPVVPEPEVDEPDPEPVVEPVPVVEPEPIVPGAPGKALEEPVERLVSVSMLVPALPVPLEPEPLLMPLVPELPDEFGKALDEPLVPLPVSELAPVPLLPVPPLMLLPVPLEPLLMPLLPPELEPLLSELEPPEP
jgi:hypothetical protein